MAELFVTIATSQSLPEAEACKLRMESEGMTVLLTDAETIRTDWLLSNAIGSIKVQVPESQVEKALSILEQIRQQHDEQAKQIDKEFCLACGAVMPKEATQCPTCGWSYESDKEEDATDDGDGT